jgi:beta-N-acetylhexosaminidase
MTPTLAELALRVQLASFPGASLPPEMGGLLERGLGGVCLFGSNTARGPEATAALTGAIRTAAPHAAVAVDEEGGDVTRLHAATGSPVLGAAALGAAGDLELTRATAWAIGTELAAAGITLDLGPVADVNSNPDNPVIGTRSFGIDADQVAAHVAAWVNGLQETGVGACAKHFPGHGDTAQDSHVELPSVGVGLSTLRARELVPFAAAVAAGSVAVMTSHIVLPTLDPSLPATLSPRVLRLLREELGYDGVIVSDALDMAGVSSGRGIPEAAVLSLAAGADLLCLGAEKGAGVVRDVQAAILRAVRSGRLAEERLVEAVARIDLLPRAGSGPGRPLEVSPDAAARQLAGARRATTVDGVLPDLRGARVVTALTAANIAVGEVPWGLPSDDEITPDSDPHAGSGPIVLQVRDAHRRPEVRSLVERVAAAGGRVVLLEWGWPGPHDGVVPRICARGYSRPGAAAVVEVLREAGWDR